MGNDPLRGYLRSGFIAAELFWLHMRIAIIHVKINLYKKCLHFIVEYGNITSARSDGCCFNRTFSSVG